MMQCEVRRCQVEVGVELEWSWGEVGVKLTLVTDLCSITSSFKIVPVGLFRLKSVERFPILREPITKLN